MPRLANIRYTNVVNIEAHRLGLNLMQSLFARCLGLGDVYEVEVALHTDDMIYSGDFAFTCRGYVQIRLLDVHFELHSISQKL